MKAHSSCLFALALAALAFTPLHAADDPSLAAVTAADEARVAAMKAGDREKLTAIFSDELRYAHSSGVVDTKSSFTEVLVSKKTKYVGYDYVERKFSFPAPDIALMTGSTHVRATTETAEMDSILGYLAVWRKENGQWRFLAWQSCKLPAAAAPK
jgi:ketosteroid isomerase-like protein